jgi:hypothetical protein
MSKIKKVVIAVITLALVALLGALVYGAYKASDQGTESLDEAYGVEEELWDSSLLLETLSVSGYGQNLIESSGTLYVEWQMTGFDIFKYRLTLTDGVSDSEQVVFVEDGTSSTLLTGLKSGTEYRVRIDACLDRVCGKIISGDDYAVATTGEEYWQVQGSGVGYDAADQVVESGSTLSYALPYGDWAPRDLQGLTKFFYNAKPGKSNDNEGGVRVASSYGDYSFFEDIKALFIRECQEVKKTEGGLMPSQDAVDCPVEQLETFAFQIVPLASGSIRYFFEASSPGDEDHITQIYSLDSQDGYVGEDFDSSPDSDICGADDERDLIEGGDCEPELLIGSSEKGHKSLLEQARQHKIGYPKIDSWLWDEAPGAFMVITGKDTCDQTRDGLFYSVWDGKEWEIEGSRKCATPLVLDAHGPVIVHMGDARYKLYYENYEYTDTQKMRFDEKPLRVMYANGAQSDDEDTVEFEDWEEEDLAREVHFLWPDGSMLNPDEEAGLGDHMIWLPENDLETQVMYMNLGGFDNKEWGRGSAGLGMAVLVNP